MKHTSNITLYSGLGADARLVVPRMHALDKKLATTDRRELLGLKPLKNSNRKRRSYKMKTLLFDLAMVVAILTAIYFGLHGLM